MRDFLAGVKRWWLRRFRGVVAPPQQYGGQGTTWQQHPQTYIGDIGFLCRCGTAIAFTKEDYVIREQEHVEGCKMITDVSTGKPATAESKAVDLRPCSCPVTDARYVKICPQCRLGHWKQAEPGEKK